ncbi:MAG: hypothetical protein WD025_03775 [Bacteriovoracaceae bacterium]
MCDFKISEVSSRIVINDIKSIEYPCLIVLPYNYSSLLKANNSKLYAVDYVNIGLLVEDKNKEQIVVSARYDFKNYIIAKVGLWFFLLIGFSLYQYKVAHVNKRVH